MEAKRESIKNASEAYENVQYERLFVLKASWVRL